MRFRAYLSAIILMLSAPHAPAASFSMVQAQTTPQCDITRSITEFGAVGSGLVDDGPAFTGGGSFLDWALNTYQSANPGKTICLTNPANSTYFIDTGTLLFGGIKNFILQANQSLYTSALNLRASGSTAAGAGNRTLTFDSVPAGVKVGMPVIDDSHKTATCDVNFANCATVASKTATTVTLSADVTAPGISTGDIISFKSNGFFFGSSAGLAQDNLHDSRVQTVSAGSSCVTLLTAAEASRFTAGRYGVMGGVDQQSFGNPQNNYRWELVVLSSVDAAHQCDRVTAGASVSFTQPLKYSYLQTWPVYNSGSNVSQDQGGPATLFVFPDDWDAVHVYNNMRFIGWDGLGNTTLNAAGRSITFNGCASTGAYGINPSQQKWLTLVGCDLSKPGPMEFDKVVENVTVVGGVVSGFGFFSASNNDTLTINGSLQTTNYDGTPGNLVIVNSTLAGGMHPGATSNGVTQSITCVNSSLGTPGIWGLGGIRDNAISAANGVTINTSGLITVPKATAENDVPWAVPGAEMYWKTSDTAEYGVPFTVGANITFDGTNTYIPTDLTGYTTLPGSGVIAAPAKTFNFSGCGGSTNVLDISQFGGHRPLTKSNRIYTCTNGVAALQAANPTVPVIDFNHPPSNEPLLARAISSITVAVTQADTSGASPVWHFGGPFDNGQIHNSAGVGSVWAPKIDLKTTGTRTYTGTSNTWSATLGADTLATTSPGFPSYLGGSFGFAPSTSIDVSAEAAAACPIVTLTINTTALEPANDNEPLSMAA